jgi:AcrR family transcriptional regulator
VKKPAAGPEHHLEPAAGNDRYLYPMTISADAPNTHARNRILATAADLFVSQGIVSTGVAQIAREAGVSKRTLYELFNTKDDLVRDYLNAADRTQLTTLANTEGSATERLLSIFDPGNFESTAVDVQRGCVFVNASVEFPETDHPAHQAARDHKTRFTAQLADFAREGGASDPELLARQLTLLYDGAASRSTVLNTDTTLDDARLIASQLIRVGLDQ